MGPRRRRLGLLAATALVLVPAWAGWVHAEEPQEPEGRIDLEELEADRGAKARLYPVNRRISRYLSAAAEEVDEGRHDEAKEVLLRLNPKRLNPLERALIFRMLAYVSYGADDLEGAIRYFEQVLEQEALPVRDEARIRFNIAQLYASLERWPDVIAWVESWLRYVQDPDPLGFYLMAIAHYQLEEVDVAITQIQKAIELARQPREPWLRLLSALYIQKEDFAKATPVLEELLLRFPKKQYWVQLSLIYGANEVYETSLAVQQLAYDQGFITEDKELRRLARSYLYHELPYPAAQVLEKGLAEGAIEADAEAYQLLANSWIAAREYDRSLPPLRRAAELSADGKLYVRLGQVHMQREEWGEAAAMLQKALAKGGLENTGNADLLLGIALYNSQQLEQARSYFVRARDHDATRAEAERWITHLENGSGAG